MRESCRIVHDTLEFVGSRIKAGMSTKEVDELVERYIRSSGAYPSCLGYGGFPASACVSVNETVVHGIPDGQTILKDGDIVSVDLCAYKNGYHGDGARTFCIGSVSPEVKKLVEVTEECFFKGIEGLKAGTPLYDIGCRVQSYAESFGYGVIRSYTGHGIGKEMRGPVRSQFREAGHGRAPEGGHGALRRTDDRNGNLARASFGRRLGRGDAGRTACGALRKHIGGTRGRRRNPDPLRSEEKQKRRNHNKKSEGISVSKDDVIEAEGKVIEALPNATFKVQLSNGHTITAYISGKLRMNYIRIIEGDNVKLEMSPYDLTKGRITWRSKS